MGKVSELAAELVKARNEEHLARERRVKIEEQILAQFSLSESQRMTVSTENGLKLTMQTGLSYKVFDKSFWKEFDFAPDDPRSMVPIKKTEKIELDVKAYEELRTANPAGFEVASQFVTVTPKKPSVSVAVI